MPTCDVILSNVELVISFQMILMYFTQVDKVPVRSLDTCLGEAVVAFMPAPPFFPAIHHLHWP